MLNSVLLSLAVALLGCGGGEDDPQPAAASLTISPETVNVPAEGGTYLVNVTTTGREWGVAMGGENFFTVKTQNTADQAGTITITVPANPVAETRTGSVTVMSGSARKYLTVNQAAAEQAAYNAPEGYQLVWHDEFNEGTELNPADWTHEVQGSGWVNHELQNYVNHTTPKGRYVTEIMDGVYAKVKEGWTYGYIEASIKLPKGKGTWPAFWMMPVNFRSWPADGEIDIMEEVGYHPDYVSSSLHANAHVHSNGTQVTHEMYCKGAEGEFHTYAIEWTAQNITTFVDGKKQLSYDNRGLGRDDWPYNDPFYVIFNLAWGGDWGGSQGVDENALPATMEVDYVRVFQKK